MGTRKGVIAVLVLVTTFFVLATGPSPQPLPDGGEVGVAALTGAGWGESLACIGCVATLVYGGGATPLGIFAFSALNPGFVGGCTYMCIIAAT